MCLLRVGTDKLDANMLAVIGLNKKDEFLGHMIDILEAASGLSET
jgi:hypothetical protein